MATEFQYSQDIYLIYNCILTRHNRGETYRLLWTKLSNVFFPPKSFSALHRSAAVVIWALPEQEVELPLAWKVPSPRECPGDSPALAVYLKRLRSEQDVQIEFEAEKGMDGNGTATERQLTMARPSILQKFL